MNTRTSKKLQIIMWRLFKKMQKRPKIHHHHHYSHFLLLRLRMRYDRSSSDGKAIRYVFPVLWMTSCFHIMVGIARIKDDAPSSSGGGTGGKVLYNTPWPHSRMRRGYLSPCFSPQRLSNLSDIPKVKVSGVSTDHVHDLYEREAKVDDDVATDVKHWADPGVVAA